MCGAKLSSPAPSEPPLAYAASSLAAALACVTCPAGQQYSQQAAPDHPWGTASRLGIAARPARCGFSCVAGQRSYVAIVSQATRGRGWRTERTGSSRARLLSVDLLAMLRASSESESSLGEARCAERRAANLSAYSPALATDSSSTSVAAPMLRRPERVERRSKSSTVSVSAGRPGNGEEGPLPVIPDRYMFVGATFGAGFPDG